MITTLASGSSTNRTLIVRYEDGSRYVLREYRWPYEGPDDLDRPEKEARLSGLVRGRGLSAPLASRGRYDISPDRVRRLCTRALPVLDSRPVRLLHNDPHPCNILVGVADGSWQCTGWLDWEFAWAGDPAWDVARLDIFCLKDIGPTPPAFEAGYGSPRPSVVYALYEFAIMLWMSIQDAGGDEAPRPTYRRAHKYLSEAGAVPAGNRGNARLRFSLGAGQLPDDDPKVRRAWPPAMANPQEAIVGS